MSFHASSASTDSSDSKQATLLIFGASGDLTSRKLIPALFSLYRNGFLADNALIVGVARRPKDDDSFRNEMRDDVLGNAPSAKATADWDRFQNLLHYVQVDLNSPSDYCALKERVEALEQAQEAKKHHIARKLLIEPGMKVLDIGCGWGGMGLTLARDYGAVVTGVTLSTEQHKIANQRAKAAGLANRAEFKLMDYREITGKFDRIVSIGMFEHVGVPHYGTYFATVSDLLTPDGVALIHSIGRSDPPGITSPWITKYIFPGGYVPALSEMTAAIEHHNLYTTDVEVWRLHYAETLRHWHDRFVANIDKARSLYDDRFCRMWRYYLIASELTFRLNRQVVFQVQLSPQQAVVPLTRDYLYHPHEAEKRSTAAE